MKKINIRNWQSISVYIIWVIGLVITLIPCCQYNPEKEYWKTGQVPISDYMGPQTCKTKSLCAMGGCMVVPA